FDGGDDRLGALSIGDAGETTLGRGQRGGLTRRDRLEVGPGAEDRAFVRDDTDPGVDVVLEAIDRRLHAGRHVAVDGVARLGAVDLEDGDASVLFVLDHA